MADEGRAVGGDEGEEEGAGGAQAVDDGGLGAVGVGGGEEGVGDERGDGGRVLGGFGADAAVVGSRSNGVEPVQVRSETPDSVLMTLPSCLRLTIIAASRDPLWNLSRV